MAGTNLYKKVLAKKRQFFCLFILYYACLLPIKIIKMFDIAWKSLSLFFFKCKNVNIFSMKNVRLVKESPALNFVNCKMFLRLSSHKIWISKKVFIRQASHLHSYFVICFNNFFQYTYIWTIHTYYFKNHVQYSNDNFLKLYCRVRSNKIESLTH